MMIRKILIFMAVLSASIMMYASGSPHDNHSHRFYSVEADNDTTAHGIEYTIDAVKSGKVETITLRMRNTRHTPFQPVKAGLKLGVDTYMDTYPEWYGKFFLTLAVCEPDHFYGYIHVRPATRLKSKCGELPPAYR